MAALRRIGPLLFSLAVAPAYLSVVSQAPAADIAGPDGPNSIIPGRYIVKLRTGVSPDSYAPILGERHGFRVDHTYRSAFRGFAARLSRDDVQRLHDDPNVLSIAPDRVVKTSGEALPMGIDRIEAGPPGDIKGAGPDRDIDVAVIDSGVDLDHPELQVAGGMASYGEAIFIWLFCGFTDTFDDANGHGTHVAGTIAARDNDVGVVGVARA